MPSGAKKRKAAKKKKEQAANNNPHGNGDPRSQDERESDGGSPGSQGDHNHQHTFSQREEEGIKGTSPIHSHVTEDKSVEEAIRDAESTTVSRSDDVVPIKIEKELGPKEDLESSLVTVQHIEHDKSSSSSSSSSSSDDESQASEKKSEQEKVTTFGNVGNLATVMSEEVPKVVENEAVGNVDSNSVVETTGIDNSVKPVLSVPEEVHHATEGSANKLVPGVVEPGLNENEENLLPPSNGIPRVELGENEGKTLSSSGTSTAESSTLVEKTQHLEPHDYSEKQPLVSPTPPVVQRTSVFSCCGLFDVFTGSGR